MSWKHWHTLWTSISIQASGACYTTPQVRVDCLFKFGLRPLCREVSASTWVGDAIQRHRPWTVTSRAAARSSAAALFAFNVTISNIIVWELGTGPRILKTETFVGESQVCQPIALFTPVANLSLGMKIECCFHLRTYTYTWRMYQWKSPGCREEIAFRW